ncbi:phosphate ABC transporter substrate-binding protein PstS [Nocardioides sp. TF02-7]|uniref:phosphate ABC transporter substrate-binding protein PstS n=1 Tax=Nocardioides sp. TF02-7 TaxID=2917724 RepID=UPI001F065BD6|nr:phosphate ABC transporter substrate-binding protein PstS [Nocardioides sp. TF02-7]UMG91092.1 phosphate ABC transporter substrate-binding protein PstS [Nocardioides sp. TF02-7]
MNRTSFRRALVPGVAALALLLTACGGDDDNGSGGNGGEASGVDYGTLEGELIAGGASSQESAQNAWLVGFQEVAPNVAVTYEPVGSGDGRTNFINGGYAFAGSDAYLTDDEGELSDATERCAGTDPIEIPNYVSPIAVIFNVPGVDELNLTPEAVAGIFAGEITSWNDPAIAESNEGANLPDADITPVHRSDESGTTENFTDYLDAAAGDVWTAGVVETWPTDAGGEAGNGTSGVVQVVTENENTIGYADASQAGGLGQANIGVGDEFVPPSADAAAKILEVSPRVEGRPDVDLAVDLDHTTAEAGVYPIVLTSYLLACQQYEDQATADLVKGYLSYVVSDEGQELAAAEAGAAPLSDSLQEEIQGIIDGISASS